MMLGFKSSESLMQLIQESDQHGSDEFKVAGRDRHWAHYSQ